MTDEKPRLRSVPTGTTEVVDAPPAIQMGGPVEPPAAPQHIAPVIGLGNMPQPVGAGALAGLGTHALAVAGTGATGAAVGLLASGEARGAVIGAGANLALLGLAGAAFGGQRMPSWLRVLYGVLALGSAAGSGYLIWTRR